MSVKKLLLTLLFFLSLTLSAQNKTFVFSEYQTRNEKQQWGNTQRVGAQLAQFTPTQINVKADKDYHLNIVSKTDLPDNGAIYLCEDEKSNPVTVMLIDNIKMYIYSTTKRYMINFDMFAGQSYMADTD